MKNSEGNFKIQSILFEKDSFNIKQAKVWAKKNKFDIEKVYVTDNYIRLRQKTPSLFNTFKTIILGEGIKATIAGKMNSLFSGNITLRNVSKFSSSAVLNADSISMPFKTEIWALCEGPNRDGVVRKSDMDESLKGWDDIPIITWHDKTNGPTIHKLTDRVGYTVGEPCLRYKDGKQWVVVPAEFIDKNMAYQLNFKNNKGKPLEVSAEYGWTPYMVDGIKYQTNIVPWMLVVVDDGHIEGNKIMLTDKMDIKNKISKVI